MVSDNCTTLRERVLSMMTSYFDIDFASQMKLTKFPSIHCFGLTLGENRSNNRLATRFLIKVLIWYKKNTNLVGLNVSLWRSGKLFVRQLSFEIENRHHQQMSNFYVYLFMPSVVPLTITEWDEEQLDLTKTKLLTWDFKNTVFYWNSLSGSPSNLVNPERYGNSILIIKGCRKIGTRRQKLVFSQCWTHNPWVLSPTVHLLSYSNILSWTNVV